MYIYIDITGEEYANQFKLQAKSREEDLALLKVGSMYLSLMPMYIYIYIYISPICVIINHLRINTHKYKNYTKKKYKL